jgi:hypothetical protein
MPLMVLVPLTCPTCGTEQFVACPVAVVVTALTRWNNMHLHSPCHPVSWNASQSELQRIRHHVGEAWIEAHSALGAALQ